MRIAGIDGCARGWVVADSDDDLHGLSFSIARTFDEILNRRYALALIDIPVGLPVSGARGCDVAARKFLGSPRCSSVFPAPHRSATEMTTRAEASAANVKAIGKGIGAHAWGILPKVREVDIVMTKELQRSVREAHPEVTFGALRASPSRPHGLTYRKKSPEGEAERLDLLVATYGVSVVLDQERARLGPGVARDDIVDAVACLVSAWRALHGTAVLFPDVAEYDLKGLRMEIVA